MTPLQPPSLPRVSGLGLLIVGALLTANPAQPDTSAVPNQATTLRLVDQIGGRSNALAVTGDTAYLGVGPRVWVLDLAGPAAPRITGMSEVLTGEVTGLVMANGLLVAACSGLYPGSSAVYVLRPAPASGPATLGRTATTGDAVDEIRRAVPVAGGAILVGRTEATFVDVRRPESPALIPFLPNLRRWWRDVVVHGQYGVASWSDVGPSALWVLDLADPAEPDVVATLPVEADRLALSGDRIYAVHGELGRDPWSLTTVDVTAPQAPTVLGEAQVAPPLGRIADAAVNAGLLYLTSLSGDLLAVDATESTAPRTLGQVNLAVEPVLIVPLGDALLMATHVYQEHNGPASGRGGLVRVAVSDPGSPRPSQLLSPLPGRVTGVTLDGGHAYATARDVAVADPGGLWALDLGTTGQPRQMYFVDQPVGAGAVLAHAATVYASAADGLRVVDVGDPAQPRLVGTVPAGGAATGMALRDGLAFMLARGGNALDVLDLGEPSLPRHLARVSQMPPRDGVIGDVLFPLQVAPAGLALTDGYVHLAEAGTHAVDVREPWWPRTVRRTWPTGADTGPAGGSMGAVAADDQLVVALSQSGLDILAAASILETRIVGHLADERIQRANRVAFADGLAVAARADGAVTAIDVTVTAQPRVVATADLPLVACGDNCHENAVNQVIIAGDRVLVATDGSGLFVLALDRPSDPTPTPRFTPAPPKGPRVFLPVAVRHGRVGKPRGAITFAGQWPPAGTVTQWVRGVALTQGVVLTGAADPSGDAMTAQLVTLDLRNPAVPAELGRSEPLAIDSADDLPDIVVAGGRALLSLGAPGLAVVEITDPTQPRVVGRLAALDRVTELAAAGGHAFVADGRWLRVVDLADPTAPRELGRLEVLPPGSSLIADLSIEGDLLLAAVRNQDAEPGVVAVSVADPQHPRVVGGALVGQPVLGLARRGDLVYAAPESIWSRPYRGHDDLAGGVIVLDVRDPGRIRDVGHRLGSSMGNVQALAWLDPATLATAAWWRMDVLDVTDTALPRHMATFPPDLADGDPVAQWVYEDIAAAADRLYVVGGGVLRVLRWSEGSD